MQGHIKKGVSLQWEKQVGLLFNPFVFYEFLKWIFWTMGLSLFILFVTFALTDSMEGFFTVAPFFGYIALGMFILSGVIMAVLYGGRAKYLYTINDTGVTQQTLNKPVRGAIALLGFLSAFSGTPTSRGTAILSRSSLAATARWKDIKKVHYYPTMHVITLKSWRVIFRVYTGSERYEEVRALIEEYRGGSSG